MEIEDRVVIITDSISVSAALVFWVFKNFSVQLHNLNIITQASLLGAEDSLCFNPGSVSSVISISSIPGFHTQLWLKQLAKVLKPDGFLLVQEPSYLNHNKQTMLGDSKASLERNLMFAGFYSIEGFPCLNLSNEINFQPQQFEVIAMKAKKSGVIESAVNFPNLLSLSITPETVCHNKEQEKADEPEDLPKDNSLDAAIRTRKKKSDTDKNVDMKEMIRERNKLYQRRRRERMTEEEKNREKERRKLYMQKRRSLQLNGSENEPQLLA